MFITRSVLTVFLVSALFPIAAFAVQSPFASLRCETDRVLPPGKTCLGSLARGGKPVVVLGGPGSGAMVFEVLQKSPLPVLPEFGLVTSSITIRYLGNVQDNGEIARPTGSGFPGGIGLIVEDRTMVPPTTTVTCTVAHIGAFTAIGFAPAITRR